MLPLKIACFGDSLTLGYLSPTLDSPFPENIPYGSYLQEWLGPNGDVVVYGVCGETTANMRDRFQSHILDSLPQVVIILGGTNDLSVSISSAAILANLQFFYEEAQAHGILPVAVTVPSLREDVWRDEVSAGSQSKPGISITLEHAIAQRVMLNQSIKELGRQRNFPVVDWFTETCEPMHQALALEYSNDGLHLTTTGYHKLAELIWSQVLQDLTKQSD